MHAYTLIVLLSATLALSIPDKIENLEDSVPGQRITFKSKVAQRDRNPHPCDMKATGCGNGCKVSSEEGGKGVADQRKKNSEKTQPSQTTQIAINLRSLLTQAANKDQRM